MTPSACPTEVPTDAPALPYRIRGDCRACGSARLSLAVPLAPIAVISPNIDEQAADAARWLRTAAPLDLWRCDDCGLLQITTVVDARLQYDHFMYQTAVSLGLREHFATLAAALAPGIAARQGWVLDIGSNDGSLLAEFQQRGVRVQGVDPARRIAEQASARGIPTVADFFTRELAAQLAARHGRAALVICNNTLANLDDLTDLVEGVRTVLADDGVFIFETQYGLDVLERMLPDVIYHEHLSYFTVEPLALFFAARGFEVIDVECIWPKGGSIRVTVQKAGGPRGRAAAVADLIAREHAAGLRGPVDAGLFATFGQRLAAIRAGLHRVIDEVQARGGEVAVYGASVGCASLIEQFALGPRVAFVVDDHPFKTRLVGPTHALPVLGSDALATRRPALVLVLAWRYARPICERHAAYLGAGGRMLVPLPDLHEPGPVAPTPPETPA